MGWELRAGAGAAEPGAAMLHPSQLTTWRPLGCLAAAAVQPARAVLAPAHCASRGGCGTQKPAGTQAQKLAGWLST